MRAEIDKRGLSSCFTLAGVRSDTLSLYRHAMDVFLFPSLHEGLGLVLIEAQSCGLSCVISDAIPREADVIPGLIQRVSLDSPDADWCAALTRALDRPRDRNLDRCREAIDRSPFGIRNSAAALWELYGC
jgi:glycosyltransferase involved in cell wall biosynthesis